MRLNEVLTESVIQDLNEGPFGQALGKAAGGLARGAGAVAGGIAGMGSAAKQGYQAGKSAVAGTGDAGASSAPGQGSAPQATPGTQAGNPNAVQSGPEVTVYKQIKNLMVKLDKKGKQRILASLAKDLNFKVVAQPIARAKPTLPAQTQTPGSNVPPVATPKVVKGGKARVA